MLRFVLINSVLLNLSRVGSCFRLLAVSLDSDFCTHRVESHEERGVGFVADHGFTSVAMDSRHFVVRRLGWTRKKP